MDVATRGVAFNGSLATDTMATVLFNATSEIDANSVDFDLSSFNETVNDTYVNDAYDIGGGGGHGNTTASLIMNYVKLIVDIFGLIGNAVVILLITVCHDLHSAANYHFLNMAIADFILLLYNFLMRISKAIDFDIFSAWECTPLYLHTVVVQTSSLTLAALSIDRFKLIVRPLKNLHEPSVVKVAVSLIAVWFVSFALHIPIELFSTKAGSYCRVILPWVHGSLVFGIYSNIVLFYLPTAIVLYCNLSILGTIQRKRPGNRYVHTASEPQNVALEVSEDDGMVTNGASAPTAATPRASSVMKSPIDAKPTNRRARSTRIVVTVVVAYIAFNLPFYAFYTISLIPGAIPREVYFSGHTYLTLLLVLNSATNPFIYSFMGSKYRRHLQQVLRCLCCSSGKLSASGPLSTDTDKPSKRPTESDRIDPPSASDERSQ